MTQIIGHTKGMVSGPHLYPAKNNLLLASGVRQTTTGFPSQILAGYARQGSTTNIAVTAQTLIGGPITLDGGRYTAGDAIELDLAYQFKQNAGSAQVWTFEFWLGGSSVISFNPSLANNASNRIGVDKVFIRLDSLTAQSIWWDHNLSAAGSPFGGYASGSGQDGVAGSVDFTSASVAIDFTVKGAATTATQNFQQFGAIIKHIPKSL